MTVNIEELTRDNQDEARSLILAGLADHWGSIDETLNPDLDDMVASYQKGRTVLIREDGFLVGTGTLFPALEASQRLSACRFRAAFASAVSDARSSTSCWQPRASGVSSRSCLRPHRHGTT